MSVHVEHHGGEQELRDLSRFGPAALVLLVVGLVVLGAALAIGLATHDVRRLAMGYLTGYASFLTVSVGALFFVAVQHLTRAGWSVTVRRLAECMAMNLWTMLLLFVPILLALPAIYRWADADQVAHDPILQEKAAWLNPAFWTIRHLLLWLGPWALMALWYWRHSLRQDRTGEVAITEKLQRNAGLMVVIFAVTVNFGYFDLLMTLDPHWYSTMFGVYAFAGSFLNFFAVSILVFRFLQWRGLVRQSVRIEHYHDMGKFMFAFIFFWSYVAFSQWMLMWYANIPEETVWYARRGGTTDDVWQPGVWGAVALVLLIGHCFIPFASLLSRSAKRRLPILTAFAAWMVVMHFVDMFWIVMPEVRSNAEQTGVDAGFAKSLLLAVLCWVGVGCVWLAGLFWFARQGSLVPLHDPRLPEALSYEVY